MRAFLYDLLTTDEDLQSELGGAGDILNRVLPRRSRDNIEGPRPFLIFGLGNSTAEDLADSTANDATAERQFFQVWVHDDSKSYLRIDRMVDMVKKRLTGQSDGKSILTIRYLETSQEFNNETYNTIFRYIRFQAIIAEGTTS